MSTRRIPASAFSDDDGRPDAALTRALTTCAGAPERRADVLAALHAARLLAPVVAVAGSTEPRDAGQSAAADLRSDPTSEIAVPLLGGTDGRRALPVFTGLASLTTWDPAARPVPVDGPRAAQVALAEGAQVLVLDPAGPLTWVLDAPELRALAEGRGAVPAYDDTRLADRVAALVTAESSVTAAWLLPAVGADARLTLQLRPSAAPHDVAALLRRVASAVGALPEWADHAVHGLDLTVLPVADPLDQAPVFRRLRD